MQADCEYFNQDERVGRARLTSSSDGTTVDAYPFQSSAQIQSLAVYAALRSAIGIGFKFDDVADVDGSANAKLYIDTPVLRAKVTPVHNVDANCHAMSASSVKGQDVVKDGVHLTFTSAFDAGYELGAKVNPQTLED